jgi:acetate---CoA ligase (ADP-forming)
MYVQYFVPFDAKGAVPLLLWHWGGLTGVTYETTPDASRPAFSAPMPYAASSDRALDSQLKVQSTDIPHKTEAGAVALNLTGADRARVAYANVLAAAKRYAPTAQIDGVLVQPMAPPGREVILGINRDPTWGLLLMVGLGVLVEALGDVALAPVPLNIVAAHALLDCLKGARIFGPFRGLPPADTEALADLMVLLA